MWNLSWTLVVAEVVQMMMTVRPFFVKKSIIVNYIIKYKDNINNIRNMTTNPLTISTAFLEREHSIIVVSNVDETNKIMEKNKVDEKDLSPVFIDNYIKKMNKLSDGLIVDYNYEIVNKETIHFIALVKHIFRKFGETLHAVEDIYFYLK